MMVCLMHHGEVSLPDASRLFVMICMYGIEL